MAHLIKTPDNCSLIENGTTTLLIKNEFKETLLKQGILDPERLIASASHPSVKHFKGRGNLPSVIIQESGGTRMVIKHCMRGGLIRLLNKDIFWGGNRPFKEMVNNVKILHNGIKTTEIIAATKHKIIGPLYKVYLFSKELSECIDLINYFDELRKKPPTQQFNEKKCIFQSIARAMVKMHSAGIYHKDLHLKNVLIQKIDSDTPAIYIIDFDKAVIKGALAPRDKVKNLLRFNRSIEKYKLKWKTITSTDQATLLNEYFKYDPEITDIFNKYKKRYNIILRLRKLKWHLVSSILKN